MLCSVCMHGVSRDKTWTCDKCSLTYCLHIRRCRQYSETRYVQELKRRAAAGEELAANLLRIWKD